MSMSPLKRLFELEVEYYRRLRTEAPDVVDPTALHTSYALQAGYEPLLRGAAGATADDLDRLVARRLVADDHRDVLAARSSLLRMLDLTPEEG
jgi:hypothetical protein